MTLTTIGNLLPGLAFEHNEIAKTAEEVRKDYAIDEYASAPTIIWQSPTEPPKAIIVTLHGLIMHGGTFDAIARRLVSQGYLVSAPDMRGYGRWLSTGKAAEVSYEESYSDIVNLVKKLKTDHPEVPVFCIGESLGADMSMRLGCEEPQLVDGLVLSSPAIKRHKFITEIVTKVPTVLTNPASQINLVPYIRRFASEDPRIVDGALKDPLVRKKLSAGEIVRSNAVFKASLGYARRIPSKIPVLVMQGSSDRVVKSNAIVRLLGCLQSSDQTVRWFNARGHLLLETDFVYPDTMQIVAGWLKEHVDEIQAMKEQAPNQDKLSEDTSKERL